LLKSNILIKPLSDCFNHSATEENIGPSIDHARLLLIMTQNVEEMPGGMWKYFPASRRDPLVYSGDSAALSRFRSR